MAATEKPAASSKASDARPFVPPVALVNAALRLRRFFLRAADAVVPPYMGLFDRFMGAATTMLVHTAAKAHIADELVGGPLDAAELARRTGSDADALERMMLALVSSGVFRREADGRFANNRVSSAMVTGSKDNARGFAEFFGFEPIVRAWANIPRTLRDGVGAFEAVHGRPVWQWMDEEPSVRAAFVEGMSSMTTVVAPAIAAAYPFGEVKTVCDVGGGVGIVLAATLKRHPHLRGMLFDSEGMLSEAGPFLDAHGIADRVERVPGSFFESIPRGADAYILKTVLHNWGDENALKILRNCRAAMDPGHRLVVADFLVVPDAFSTLVPYMDIAGMMIFSGRERSTERLKQMFAETGFRFGRVMPLPGVQAVYEGVAV